MERDFRGSRATARNSASRVSGPSNTTVPWEGGSPFVALCTPMFTTSAFTSAPSLAVNMARP